MSDDHEAPNDTDSSDKPVAPDEPRATPTNAETAANAAEKMPKPAVPPLGEIPQVVVPPMAEIPHVDVPPLDPNRAKEVAESKEKPAPQAQPESNPGTPGAPIPPETYPVPNPPTEYAMPNAPADYPVPNPPEAYAVPNPPADYPIPNPPADYPVPSPPEA